MDNKKVLFISNNINDLESVMNNKGNLNSEGIVLPTSYIFEHEKNYNYHNLELFNFRVKYKINFEKIFKEAFFYNFDENNVLKNPKSSPFNDFINRESYLLGVPRSRYSNENREILRYEILRYIKTFDEVVYYGEFSKKAIKDYFNFFDLFVFNEEYLSFWDSKEFLEVFSRSNAVVFKVSNSKCSNFNFENLNESDYFIDRSVYINCIDFLSYKFGSGMDVLFEDIFLHLNNRSSKKIGLNEYKALLMIRNSKSIKELELFEKLKKEQVNTYTYSYSDIVNLLIFNKLVSKNVIESVEVLELSDEGLLFFEYICDDLKNCDKFSFRVVNNKFKTSERSIVIKNEYFNMFIKLIKEQKNYQRRLFLNDLNDCIINNY